MQSYKINEIFDSIQGEGEDTGMSVTFVRFAECNLACSFCDTHFTSYTHMTAKEIASRCGSYTVFTGGEPLLQDLRALVDCMGDRTIGIETNGTLPIPEYLRCKISLSPKVPRRRCAVKETVNSLKILYPYLYGICADDWLSFPADYVSLQVINPESGVHIKNAVNEVKRLGPPWRLGIQIHKLIGVR
jgi:organic radical activating enzyme